MEITNPENNKISGLSRVLKACAVLAAITVIAFIILLVTLFRTPSVRGLIECKENMQTIGGALGRYSDVTGKYPEYLQSLKKDYLKDPAVLRCPLDKSGEGETSYTYHRPSPNAPSTFIMLECGRHRLKRDMPPTMLMLLKDGTFRAPTFRETMREVEKSKK